MKTYKIIGPPGTGKTETGMKIVEQELVDCRPEQIAYVSYTKAAVKEAKDRALKKFPNIKEKQLMHFRTLHSLCYEECGIIKDQVVDNNKLMEFSEIVGEKVHVSDEIVMEGTSDGGEVLSAYNNIRNKFVDNIFSVYNGYYSNHRVNYIIETYDNWKKSNEYMDFTDFLFDYNKYGDPLDVKIAIIDEAQDLSALQIQVVKRLFQNCESFYIIGDDDQAIYTWAGVDGKNFLNWKADINIELSQSYRVPREPWKFAGGIVSNIENRIVKNYQPKDSDGIVDKTSYFPDFDDHTFILYRNRYQSKDIKTALEYYIEPYSGAGSPLDTARYKRGIIAWEYIRNNKQFTVRNLSNAVRFLNQREVPVLEKGMKTQILGMTNFNDIVNREDYFPVVHGGEIPTWDKALLLIKEYEFFKKYVGKHGFSVLEDKPKIELMTLHQSKGKEADTVMLFPDMSRRSYDGYIKDQDNEHRLYYVGATRTKNKLILMQNKTMKFYRW